jgi:hypothetical protein
VLELTLAQLAGYLAAVARQEREALRARLVLARAAQADARGYRRVLEGLEP